TAADGVDVTMTLQSGTGFLNGTDVRQTESGSATFDNLSISVTGSKTLRASAGEGFLDSASFDITPGNLFRLVILAPGESLAPITGKSGTPSTQFTDMPFNVTVHGVDSFYNIVDTDDTVQITSSDGLATLPADTALVNGTVVLPVTLATPGNQTVTATDVTNGSILANTSTINVVVQPRYRTIASGNWNDPAIWEISEDGGNTWDAAISTPTSADGLILVSNTHTVTVTANVSVDQTTVEQGAQITVNSGVTLTVANGPGTDLSVSGVVQNAGTITPAGTIVFGSTGKYQHNQNAGVIPAAIWNDGSEMEHIGGTTGTTASGWGQNFYHVTWNCPSQTGNQNIAGELTTVRGNFHLKDAGATGTVHVRLTGSSTVTISIYGDVIVDDGVLTGGNSTGVATLNIGGDVQLNSGQIWLKDGNVTGGSIWNITNNLTVSSGTQLRKNSTGNGNMEINFSGAGLQTYVNNGTVGSNIVWTVRSGSVLDVGTSLITGGGTGSAFTLESGGGLRTANAGGISTSGASGSIQISGARNFSSGADYTYNGSVAQVTGSGLPATVNNLTIANAAAAVSLTAGVTVNGTLTVDAGANLNFDSKTVTCAGPPSLGGALTMQVNKTAPNTFSGAKLTQTAGTLTYGGTVTVTASGNALSAGDSIPLFDSTGGFGGGFTTVTGPTVPAGLARDVTQLTGGTGGNIEITCDGTLVADAGSDQSICPSGSVGIGGSPTASGGSGGYTYSWSPATGLDNANIANPTASPASTTEYTVTVTDASGCTAQDSVTVTVNTPPTVDAGSDQTICSGGGALIGGSPTASGTGPFTYSWSPATGLDDDEAANPTASPTTTTEYTVTVTDGNGCTAQDSVTVTVNNEPEVVTHPESVAGCPGSEAQFTVSATGGDLNYAWRKLGAGWGTANGWQLDPTSNTGQRGFFIGDSTGNAGGSSGINTSGKAWGLYANSGQVASAVRNFGGAMDVGSTFQIDMDNGWIESGGTVGFGLQNSSGENVLEFYFANGQSSYTISAGSVSPAPSIGFTGDGLRIKITLTSATTYSATVETPVGGTTYGPFTGSLLSPGGGQSITRLRLFNANAGTDAERNAYFNSISLRGREDSAAAYTSWTDGDNLGNAPLANGGNISGADTDTLTIDPVGAGDVGSYDVVVWNTCGQDVSDPATLTLNCPPVAGTDSYDRTAGLQLLISIADLLTNDSDPDLDTVSYAGLTSLTTTNGTTLITNNLFILYTNSVSLNVNDQFSYVITDGNGLYATGIVNITVITEQYSTNSITKLQVGVPEAGKNTIVFAGIPGVEYTLQRNTNLTEGVGWVDIFTDDTGGLMQHVDDFSDIPGVPPNPAPSEAYYRLKYQTP
ncbi:MAG TPA: cadherin-like domain-containing protein, partial [Verrucomicrobiota bacterium]|nr:cadherin-like domain-containing protein [Verrucomicrobiota bacterium]